VPFSLCFDVFSQCPEPLWFFEAFVDWFFVADIVFNFFTGVFVDTIADNVKNGSKHAAQTTAGAVSSAPLVIAKQYVQSWFFIDVIASAPIDFFMSLSLNGCEAGSSDLQGSELGALKLLRALRLAKLLKLLRLLRISGLLENIQDHLPFNLAVFQSLKMSIITLFTGHILACVWFVVGIQNVRRGKPSWLSTSRYPLAVQTVVNGTTTENTYDLYVASLYWAFTTMTTVGYGDLTPEGSDERLLAIFAMIVGVTVFGYIIGNASSIVANANAASAKISAQMDTLNIWMADRGLPRPLQAAIRKYFRYLWSRKTASTDEEAIIANLSSSLRVSLLRFINKDIIDQVRLFDVCSDPGFFNIIVQAMRPLCCTPPDVIVQEAKMGTEMFFLLQGRVEVLRAGTRPAELPLKIAELTTGDFFGEMALLDHKHSLPGLKANRRSATVRALKWCELQSIEKAALLAALNAFPEVREYFLGIMRARVAQLRDVAQRDEAGQEPPPLAAPAIPSSGPSTSADAVPLNLAASIATVQKMQRWRRIARQAELERDGVDDCAAGEAATASSFTAVAAAASVFPRLDADDEKPENV